ncbi:hypothetical protein FSOLCH5_013308 [Fusarium solani]
MVDEVARKLGCQSYTGEIVSEEEKGAVIDRWIHGHEEDEWPVIVATSALGPGFDYAHVRFVIHAGPPSIMTDFSQESGRAGRDGKVAESIILLSAAWQPRLEGEPLSEDEESMQLYLTQQHCCRGVMSQFLDSLDDWRWCMAGDELCGVCPGYYSERRPSGVKLSLSGTKPPSSPPIDFPPPSSSPRAAAKPAKSTRQSGNGGGGGSGHRGSRSIWRETILDEGGEKVIVVSAMAVEEEEEEEGTENQGQDEDEGEDEVGGGVGMVRQGMTFTGPAEVLRQDHVRGEALRRYERDLEVMEGCCLYCRVECMPWEHRASSCSRRHDWIRAKKKALADCKGRKVEWMDRFSVCWRCYQPQEVCREADTAVQGAGECRYRDMIMPVCFGAFTRPDSGRWFEKHFGRSFKTVEEYMIWLGKAASLDGTRCVQANRVAAIILGELG